MNKQELINEIAEDADLSKAEVGRVLDTLGLCAQNALTQGDEVVLPGIGKLKTKERAARTSRNPKTGEAVEVPAKTVVKFSPAKALKEAV